MFCTTMEAVPLISIVIPVFNAEKYIRKCINSILCQTLVDFELICVNDVSTDNSLSILEEYAAKDPRIKVINNKENLIGGSYNVGIKAAVSEYVAVVDNDDWLEPDMYEKLYRATATGSVDIVFCNYYVHYPEGKKEYINGELNSSEFNSLTDIPNKVLKHQIGPPWSFLVRKSLYVNNNIWFPEHKFFADNAVTEPLLCSAHSMVKIDDFLYHWRYDNVSITRRKNDIRMFTRVDVAISFLENMKRLGFYEKYGEIIEYRFYELCFKNTMRYYFDDFDHISLNKISQLRKTYLNNAKGNVAFNRYYDKRDGVNKLMVAYLKNVYWGYAYNKFLRPIAKKLKKLYNF